MRDIVKASLLPGGSPARSLGVIINAPWYYDRRALAVQQAALGPDHPDLADTLDNYADILVMNGRGAEAARLKARAARIRAKAG